MLKLLILVIDFFMWLLIEREVSEEVNLDKFEDILIVWRYKFLIILDYLREILEGYVF